MDLRSISVTAVKGIGAQKAEDLAALGIHNVQDLIEYFPFRYDDYRLKEVTDAADGEKITIKASVCGLPVLRRYGRSKSRMACKMNAGRAMITAVWFNQHFLLERIRPGEELVLTGKWDQRRRQIIVSETEFPGSGTAKTGSLQPVYHVSGSISQKWLRKVIRQALAQYGESIAEILPEELIRKYDLLPRSRAIWLIHHPEDFQSGQEARKRLVYEELFLFQIKLQAFRALSRKKADGTAHPVNMEEVRRFVRSLPFSLTASQKQAIADILRDMREPYAMNRLLQGDVGSGKTVVAAAALFAAVTAGCQGAFMVPTEILAEQHARFLRKLFAPFGVQLELLTGSLTERQRKDVLASLQMGLTDIVVGTHALIQEGVVFRNLGLVVTDEQHRFGVNQRSVLRRKGAYPDVLTMTATPIPRTLAITAFGDLDVSTLRELPKGRKPVKTYWVKHDFLPRILAFIGKEVSAGHQAYFICPLIEESDKLSVQNAIELHAHLQSEFAGLCVGLLHGQMPADEKEKVMQDFAENRVHILVSTTVIEVGIDVPNATVMVIYDADRFGLSQLHQLRGRVGRGESQSYCILIADPKTEVGRERMKIMTETNDGFQIAQKDLELRGPGDFFGTKQSGLPEFRLADMVSDYALLEAARDDALELVRRPAFWTEAKYLPLRHYLQQEQIFTGEVLD